MHCYRIKYNQGKRLLCGIIMILYAKYNLIEKLSYYDYVCDILYFCALNKNLTIIYIALMAYFILRPTNAVYI